MGFLLPAPSLLDFLAWLLLFLVLLTLAPSKQVSTWEKVQLQECLWAGEWGLRVAGTGPPQWDKPWRSWLLGVKGREWEEGKWQLPSRSY